MHPVEPANATWRKSRRSYANGACVEVARLSTDLIGVRDSKNPTGAILVVERAEWRRFVHGVKGQGSDAA